MKLSLHQKTMLNHLAMSRRIKLLNYYAVFSALFALYYNYDEIEGIKYDQDYAINNGVVYG